LSSQPNTEQVSEATAALRARLPDLPFDDSPAHIAEQSLDTYWKAKALAAAGRPILADGVVRPKSAEQVGQVLAAAGELGIPIVPRGGGSGSQGGAVPQLGGVMLDLSGLDSIVEFDDESCTVRVQAGVPGQELEDRLNERGYTFPHFPASVHLARVGGYLAAKGSGVLSTKYGKIEDLVASMQVALPDGSLMRTVPVPRHSIGPDLNQLFIGSEGAFGVITEATLLVMPLPERRSFRMVGFDGLEPAMAAMRGILQAGWRPCVARLSDESATDSNLAKVLNSDLSGVKLILGFDGPAARVEFEQREVLKLLEAGGGRDEGSEIADLWWENRYKIYYPPFRPELPFIWGTADVVAPFSRMLPAYRALREHMLGEYERYDLHFSGHFSHWYPWGAMVYGRFTVRSPPEDLDESVALYDDIWRRSSRLMLEHGVVLNDHHGVGLKLADDMPAQWGDAWPLLQRIKACIDPSGMMNPGKLGL